jgi:SMC interacting uncharacterized protein involved in chromosome segregation
MAKMKKDNKVLDVRDEFINYYLQDGYDLVDQETGETVQKATGGRMVSLAEHNAVLEELEALKAAQDNNKITELQQIIKDKNEEIKALEADNDRLTKTLKGQTNNSGSNRR